MADALGIEMDSWVEEKKFLLEPSSSSREDHDSLVVGHSLKKGWTGCCCSCFAGPGEPTSLPRKQCCRCFDIGSNAWGMLCWVEEGPSKWESVFCFNIELEETWEGMSRHVPPPVPEPKPRLPTLADPSGEKLWSSASGVTPWIYLHSQLRYQEIALSSLPSFRSEFAATWQC